MSCFFSYRIDQPYKYSFGSELSTGNLFIADSFNKQLLKVKSLEQVGNIKLNVENSNLFCSGQCSPANTLQNPKSFAFDLNQQLHFIDGNKIKSKSADGVVKTLVGNFDDMSSAYKPMGCNRSFPIEKMQFYWPTQLIINPIDNNIYIIDEQVIYRIIISLNVVEVVVGAPYGCEFITSDDAAMTHVYNSNKFVKLNNPVDIAFSPEGDLFILENDKSQYKQVKLLKSNGELEVYFKNPSARKGYEVEAVPAFTGFNDPVSIAVHQNRSVYVLDKGDNVLYHIKNSIGKDEYSNKYTIVSPETREAYIFNRYGLHLSTVDLLTGSTMFNFTYNGNALYGKLTSIVDQHKVLLTVKRDFHGRAELIQTSNSFNIRIKLNNFNMLRSLVTSDNRSFNFNYLSNTGLLSSSSESSSKVTSFSYEKSGKVKEVRILFD